MSWSLEEAISYYKALGAPRDQSALISLLKEIQQENGGAIPKAALSAVAGACGIRETYLYAVIKRVPRLHLSDSHLLEVCAGSNCGKCTALAAFCEKLQSSDVTVRFVPCLRMCGKGPNIRWDGQVFHNADEELICRLTGKDTHI